MLKSLPVVLCLGLASATSFAQGTSVGPTTQNADQFAGSYKGSAKNPAGDIALTLEIKSEGGKISGRLVAPQNEQPIASAAIVAGKLVVKLGAGAGTSTLTLEAHEDKLVGDWASGGQTRAVEFKKEPPAADVSGVWDAAADVQGQALPFTLTLKVEGEKVTGSSSSQLGDSTITTGSWKDGKLAFVLEGSSGPIAMIATLTDGKLVGDFDANGQLQGKWVATKRK